jgi:excisionase family DNA binding protein
LGRKYLTSNQTAQRLAVSPKTVARWAKQGLLPHLRTLGGHRRYDPQSTAATTPRWSTNSAANSPTNPNHPTPLPPSSDPRPRPRR